MSAVTSEGRSRNGKYCSSGKTKNVAGLVATGAVVFAVGLGEIALTAKSQICCGVRFGERPIMPLDRRSKLWLEPLRWKAVGDGGPECWLPPPAPGRPGLEGPLLLIGVNVENANDNRPGPLPLELADEADPQLCLLALSRRRWDCESDSC